LSARAGLGRQTSFVGGAFAALPFRERYFTHVWCVERILDPREADARLREVHRVVRPGGHVALQASGSAPQWAHNAVAALRSLGFVEIETGKLERGRIAESTRLARERLLKHLENKDDTGARLALELRERYAAAAEMRRTVTQVFARKTSA
jgi:ubiquinone/menaquinone biosynthesis C-methylase UbiE